MPRHIFGINESQIRFVDQRRCLEAMPSTLSGHASSRDLMKLPLYERNQSVEGGLVALTPFQKESRSLRGVVGNIAILCPFRSCTRLAVFPALRTEGDKWLSRIVQDYRS